MSVPPERQSPLEAICARRVFGRRPEGIAAALLPFDINGQIDFDSYARHLLDIAGAGLACAVNMDTGYANLLTTEERGEVLRYAREVLGARARLVAGVFIEDREGDPAELYCSEIERVASAGAIPILFPTRRLHGAPTGEILRVYRSASKAAPSLLAFELSPVFAPNGHIFDDSVFRGLLDIPNLAGMKHSSLDRLLELNRLEVRNRERPDFRIYTGNDLAIDMIEWGSDYLLGLAAFCPWKFAERDRLWELGDPAYLSLSDSLQDLGNAAFRPPVPAYKHSAAIFLHACGRIDFPDAHPLSPARPSFFEADLMRGCANRLGLILD